MKIDAIRQENYKYNNYNKNRKTTFGTCSCTPESKADSYDLKRLRAVVTGMIMTGFAVIAAILLFYFKKGKPNK